jgi:hypothetical protein
MLNACLISPVHETSPFISYVLCIKAHYLDAESTLSLTDFNFFNETAATNFENLFSRLTFLKENIRSQQFPWYQKKGLHNFDFDVRCLSAWETGFPVGEFDVLFLVRSKRTHSH